MAKLPNSGLRFEAKYLVDPAVRAAIWHDLLALMEPDEHQDASGYGVESLYFDTPSLAQYRFKMDGLPRRAKFRIRRYSGESAPLHLEAKEKIIDRIRKRRTLLEDDDYQDVISGRTPKRESDVLTVFAMERARHSLSPAAIVRYQRHAFVYRGDSAIRVTIDSDLHAQHAASFERPRSSPCPVLSPGQSILELKWRAGLPHWLQTIVHKYSLRNLPLSKYCMGIDALMHRGAIRHA